MKRWRHVQSVGILLRNPLYADSEARERTLLSDIARKSARQAEERPQRSGGKPFIPPFKYGLQSFGRSLTVPSSHHTGVMT